METSHVNNETILWTPPGPVQYPAPGGGGAGAAVVQAGSIDLTSGVSTIAVVFTTTFNSVPTVLVSMAIPAGSDNIYADVQQATITVNGFTATLSAPTDNANYKLHWQAASAT